MAGPDSGVQGHLQPLPRDFFQVAPELLAPALLGKLLVREPEKPGEQRLVIRLLETEAYSQHEPACHAYRGRTAANATLFGPPGHAYVYFTYGMHYCCNATCGSADGAAGALLRAGRVLEGVEQARRRRPRCHQDHALARGPACLAACLGIDRRLDGCDLVSGGRGLWLARDAASDTQFNVARGPRVGVRLAADLDWRFHVDNAPEVSAYRRHPKAETPASAFGPG